MTSGIADIHVKVQRKKLTVMGMGKTNRGQRYIRASKDLAVEKMSDEKFKAELATAVTELIG